MQAGIPAYAENVKDTESTEEAEVSEDSKDTEDTEDSADAEAEMPRESGRFPSFSCCF